MNKGEKCLSFIKSLMTDDNVHYQQSMLLSAALEEKDILFRSASCFHPDMMSSPKGRNATNSIPIPDTNVFPISKMYVDRQQSYPDQDHSIGDYRRHLYHSLR